MMLVTEELRSTEQKILVVDKQSSELLKKLKSALIKYDSDVFVSPYVLPNFQSFGVCFFINESEKLLKKLCFSSVKNRCIFIFSHKTPIKENHFKYAEKTDNDIKIINISNTRVIDTETLQKILWFSFSQTGEKEITVNPSTQLEKENTVPLLPKKPSSIHKHTHPLTFKKIFLSVALVFLVFHILFIPPLVVSALYFYKSLTALKNKNSPLTSQYLSAANGNLDVSKKLYALSRPTFLLLLLSNTLDGILQQADSVSIILEKSNNLYANVNTFFTLVLNKHKTTAEQDTLLKLKAIISSDMDVLDQDMTDLIQKMPEWQQLAKTKTQLKEAVNGIEIAQKFFPNLDSLLGKDAEKKYLVMFANNMELRPGGGFIGSFGIVSVKNYTLEDIKVYDVYDADGQLKIHIDPPAPIRKYLQQPHWFLRDSAFSPDFQENYQQAKVFLKDEMNFNSFDGGILLTTTTIQNILDAMGDLYVPEFKETVNKDNFYIKAQLYSEKDFFPGSTQKKRFLSAIADQLFVNLEHTPQLKLAQMLKKSLEEKQMVMYFEDPAIQSTIDNLYWSGHIITPQCPTLNTNCISNYLFPIEANLGVNKANFFTKKYISLKTNINQQGTAHNVMQETILNQSENDIYPGGTYKPYFQLLLPANATINSVTKNGIPVEGYEVMTTTSKKIGFYLEILPQSAAKIIIDYTIDTNLQKGKGAYQLVLQKQIGSPNSEFQFSITFPKNIYTVSQNFSSLVKDNEIVYNTTLTADKIFFIELFKE